MLIVVPSHRFLKDSKLAQRRGLDLAKLDAVIALLSAQSELPDRFHDHGLTGGWKGYRDCHISPDWLLIYPDWLLIYKADEKTLFLARTGTHSDLFTK